MTGTNWCNAQVILKILINQLRALSIFNQSLPCLKRTFKAAAAFSTFHTYSSYLVALFYFFLIHVVLNLYEHSRLNS